MLSRSQIFGGDNLKTFRDFKEKGQIISNLNLFESCNDSLYFSENRLNLRYLYNISQFAKNYDSLTLFFS